MNLRLLLSYHYHAKTDLAAAFAERFVRPWPHVFADSGAYSALTQGARIELGAYADWLHQNADVIRAYANLDVIGDADKTWRNQQRLEARGLAPIPVFHAGEDMRHLDRYLDAGYAYIALGGMVGKRLPQQMPWAVECFRRARGRAVFHGFGLATWRALAALPWHSIDAFTWGVGFKFGEVSVFDESRGFFRINLGDHRAAYANASLVRSYGYDPADFADRTRCTRAMICGISGLSYLRAEQWLRRRHGPVHVPRTPDAAPGVNIYLVATLEDAALAQRAAIDRALLEVNSS